jgi:hypothetical protein
MGACDYSCFIHGEEGEQCLELHEACVEHDTNNNPLETDALVSDDNIEHDPDFGAEDCYLMLFELSADIDTVFKKIKDGDYDTRFCIKDTYELDYWDFQTITGYGAVWLDETNHSAYRYSIWKTEDQRWALNVCPSCYKNFLINQSFPLCSTYLRNTCNKHNIECGSGKQETLERIRDHFKYLKINV